MRLTAPRADAWFALTVLGHAGAFDQKGSADNHTIGRLYAHRFVTNQTRHRLIEPAGNLFGPVFQLPLDGQLALFCEQESEAGARIGNIF